MGTLRYMITVAVHCLLRELCELLSVALILFYHSVLAIMSEFCDTVMRAV